MAEELPDLLDELSERDPSLLHDPERLRAELDEREWELLWRCGQGGGRKPLSDPEATGKISLSSPGLRNSENNRCLVGLRAILALAREDHGMADLLDPTRRLSLPREDPRREWLWPDQFQALLDAAAALDECVDARGRYQTQGRHAAVALLGLGGVRVSDFRTACWGHFSEADATLWIPKSKTAAGRRRLLLHPLPFAELVRRRESLPASRTGPQNPIWPTDTRRGRDRASVRNRLLAPVIQAADELLSQRGQRPLPRADLTR